MTGTCDCGASVPAGRRHCAFCRRTIRLVRERRCVACTEPVEDYGRHVYGLCWACLHRHVRVGAATRRLLLQAATARYADKRRVAA